MSTAPTSTPFQVNLRGVVDLFSRHIYSSPRVYLRELLQNAVDAISARRELEPNHPEAPHWRIQVRPLTAETGELTVRDDGIGLTHEEAAELLATVGTTSKRDILDFPREDYLGQFGIGLLSCFMVADEIRVVSRSARGDAPIEWCGNSNGSFTLRTLEEPVAVGTTVHLRPRFDGGEWVAPALVAQLATEFGQYLPVPVWVGPKQTAQTINQPAVFLDAKADPAQVASLGQDLVGSAPLAVIPLSCPETGTAGVGFVLPFAPAPGAGPTTRLYLGRMLVSERADRVLPDWAFFVRACINSTGLAPTASREDLVQDYKLELTREALGRDIKRWLTSASTTPVFEHFLAVHEAGLKQMVLYDQELARLVTGYLSLETSLGRRKIEQLVRDHKRLRYTRTVEEFRQVVGIGAEGDPVINGGYTWDSDLAQLLTSLYGLEVSEVDLLAELDQLDPPPPDDRTTALDLQRRAGTALQGRDCEVVVRLMSGPRLPAFIVADPELFRRLDRSRASEVASPLWREVLSFTGAQAEAHSRLGGKAASRLCLNWGNDAVRALARVPDGAVFDRCTQLLYTQAQLASQRPVSVADRKLLASALSELVTISAAAASPTRPAHSAGSDYLHG
ncbi:MAG: HSP90 family protein [Bifidobacteriaceae bacterium]|nr:HSP90 family protein [Bifidobacteriaceae bacterium]